ncbi:MAG: PEP-CTERM sorting domain-containing protein [Verrucomicrobiota bacterium]|nr:PEP-CTERM sorting domain-containing protein [Verrucomicrobiota bacterium]
MSLNGVPLTRWDFWFREGIYVVPEPAPAWLVFLGGALFLSARRKCCQKPAAS